MARALERLYERMMREYGPQGWWPLVAHAGVDPVKAGAKRGYHPGDYTFPHNEEERFEICIGAILTQNTAWTGAEKALLNMHAAAALSPRAMVRIDDASLAAALRPAGFFNAKARKVRVFADAYERFRGRAPSRDELLAIFGVGPETADSIRLYAYAQPEMVVDAYTRRILAHMGLAPPDASYADLKAFCEAGLPRDVVVYQEFHALIVEHAKRHHRRRPYVDPLLQPPRRLVDHDAAGPPRQDGL